MLWTTERIYVNQIFNPTTMTLQKIAKIAEMTEIIRIHPIAKILTFLYNITCFKQF